MKTNGESLSKYNKFIAFYYRLTHQLIRNHLNHFIVHLSCYIIFNTDESYDIYKVEELDFYREIRYFFHHSLRRWNWMFLINIFSYLFFLRLFKRRTSLSWKDYGCNWAGFKVFFRCCRFSSDSRQPSTQINDLLLYKKKKQFYARSEEKWRDDKSSVFIPEVEQIILSRQHGWLSQTDVSIIRSSTD